MRLGQLLSHWPRAGWDEPQAINGSWRPGAWPQAWASSPPSRSCSGKKSPVFQGLGLLAPPTPTRTPNSHPHCQLPPALPTPAPPTPTRTSLQLLPSTDSWASSQGCSLFRGDTGPHRVGTQHVSPSQTSPQLHPHQGSRQEADAPPSPHPGQVTHRAQPGAAGGHRPQGPWCLPTVGRRRASLTLGPAGRGG